MMNNPNKHIHSEPGGEVIETGRNQHTLICSAYCPWCETRTIQAVAYSFNTAIRHECRGCNRAIWNETHYSVASNRHYTQLRSTFRAAPIDEELFINVVPLNEQCLLCRAYSYDPDEGHPPSKFCDRPNIVEEV